jgi:peroxiredoxin (alkyl hydroperoxide reductase subunit C)
METMQEKDQITTMPRIGDEAPKFSTVTTQGDINFPGDYAGKWVILFRHPVDFTPVCISELPQFVLQNL